MDARDWHLIDDLFQRALMCPPGERSAWLDAQTDVDAGVVVAVRDMLAADAAGGPSLRSAIGAESARLQIDTGARRGGADERAGVTQLRRSIVSWISFLTR